MASKVFGRIHSIDSLSCIDGRGGPRYMVFLQGCLLRCKICSNPDTWKLNDGKIMSSDELVEKIGHAKPFLTKGGVTFSGGEPLLQPQFTKDVFQKVKTQLNLSTCIDTAGHAPVENMDLVLPYVDHVLFCIKHPNPDEYQRFTGKSQHLSKHFLERLSKYDTPFSIRYVIVPGITDRIEDINKLVSMCNAYSNCTDVELLPYHTLGVHKWKFMNLSYHLHDIVPPSTENMIVIKEYIESFGIKVVM